LQLHVVNKLRKLKMPESHTKVLPSCISPPKLELKPLPENLKYAYLGDDETLPIIISNANKRINLLGCLENIVKR